MPSLLKIKEKTLTINSKKQFKKGLQELLQVRIVSLYP